MATEEGNIAAGETTEGCRVATHYTAEDPTAANTLIHTMLNNEMTVPFLEFTSYALNCFNEFNTLFQSASPKLYLLQERVSCLIKDFAQNVMHFKYVVDCCLTKIDPYLSTQFVPLEKVYLGMAATESIKNFRRTTNNLKSNIVALFIFKRF